MESGFYTRPVVKKILTEGQISVRRGISQGIIWLLVETGLFSCHYSYYYPNTAHTLIS